MKAIIIFLNFFLMISCSQKSPEHRRLDKPHDQTSLITLVNNCQGSCEQSFVSSHQDLPGGILSVETLIPETNDGSSLLHVRLKEPSRLEDSLVWLEKEQGIAFAAPNYIYETQREDQEFPSSGNRDHLNAIDGYKARIIEPGDSSVLIAVTDDGFDLDHEDLQDSFYINPGEDGFDANGYSKRNNGIDDDNNGLVDDYQGWDFTGAGDNDPRPTSSDYHGTHIAGIIAARVDQDNAAEGLAPGLRVLPIRFSGDGQWSSVRVVRSYQYAADMGAKIINTSYSIDQYADDIVYQTILDSMYDRGLLIFNSAGNRGIRNPSRQKFEKLILVGNTYAKSSRQDEINPNSNYGVGIDIYAPGDVYSTLPGNRYGTRTGTSMATPIAASVAGMIWSQNPTWTREQVVAQLFGTTDSLAEKNVNKALYTGHGRVNARRALEGDVSLPEVELVSNLIPESSGDILVRVKGLIDPRFINNHFIVVVNENGDRIDIDWQNEYAVGSNILRLKIRSPKLGRYRFILSKAIENPLGTRISESTQRFEFQLVSDREALPVINRFELESLAVPLGRSLGIEVDMVPRGAPLAKLGLKVRQIASDQVLNLEGYLALNQEIQRVNIQTFYPSLDAGSYEIQSAYLEDDYGQAFTIPNEVFALSNRFSILGEGEYDLVQSPVSQIILPEVAQGGTILPLTLNLDPNTKIQSAFAELRGVETLNAIRSEEYQFLNGNTLQINITLGEITVREDYYISKIILTLDNGETKALLGRPGKAFFNDSKLRNQLIYIVDDLESDIARPVIDDIQIIGQDLSSRDVEVLVHARDDQDDITDVQVVLSNSFLLVNSTSFEEVAPGKYSVTIEMPEWSQDGYYQVFKASVTDGSGNARILSRGPEESNFFQDTDIPVESISLLGASSQDYKSPEVVGLILSSKNPDMITADIFIRDQSPINWVDLALVDSFNRRVYVAPSSFSQTGRRISLVIPVDDSSLLIRPETLVISDQAGNTTALGRWELLDILR
ncbi:S8 family serine peptidase [Pseudobacteriovorax antillogorgiicola]|uniref:Serine protease, subtilisin family n=1 Tax=Pseudobacteriovorax antillogorgiicola TaxID=1513793 RepID=A0A1Y6CP75_9BACT|nr:S8 family serine peptidase [Pseudobacteriovorax antillogorgiicola]TCS46342.1 subtilisin family serine protease [Pseudobacteriovorax antillogorgiicola]SMF68043.1 Serine protease, subtilisin family [Pseudobacteriovorax antillogorgiicola]